MKPVLFQSGPTLGNELYFSLEAHFLSCTDFSIILRFPRFMCKNIWIPFINILFFQSCGRFCYIIVLLLFCYIMIILLYHIFLLKYIIFKNQNTIYSTDNLFYMFFSCACYEPSCACISMRILEALVPCWPRPLFALIITNFSYWKE